MYLTRSGPGREFNHIRCGDTTSSTPAPADARREPPRVSAGPHPGLRSPHTTHPWNRRGDHSTTESTCCRAESIPTLPCFTHSKNTGMFLFLSKHPGLSAPYTSNPGSRRGDHSSTESTCSRAKSVPTLPYFTHSENTGRPSFVFQASKS